MAGLKRKGTGEPVILPGGRKGIKLWIKIVVAAVLIIAIIACSAFYVVKSIFSYNYNEIEKTPEILGFEEVKDERIINIALFGVDTRSEDSFKGRSDAIMILSVNTGTNKIKLISVMRDSFVPITQNGSTYHNKINSAYANGGPELAIKTLNTIFDLDISEYVTVNFFRLAEIIDLVGGVEIEVTPSEISHINSGVREVCYAKGETYTGPDITSSGIQHLNGVQATAYSRIRYTSNFEGTNNDYGRTDRQRYVMEQLYKKVLAMDKAQYAKLVKPILACCETSLTYGEIIQVILGVLSKNPTFEETRVPETSFLMTSPRTNAGSVVYYDLNFAAKLIHSFIYKDIKPQKFIDTNGIEKNDWFAKGFTAPEIED